MRRRKTILVTGSSGRLGSAVVRLLKDRHQIVRLDSREPADAKQSTGEPQILGSITDAAIVARAMDGVDTVIHCAAIPWGRPPFHEVVETNVMGTFHLLEAAGRSEHVEQFIYISSIMWHGLSEPPYKNIPIYLPIDEHHPSLAVDYYACSKVQAEYWCMKYVERFGKPVVAIRPSMIVSLQDEPAYHATAAGACPHLHDYIGVTDLVDGIERALDYHPRDGVEAFLFHAADQHSTTPSLELAARYWPDVPVQREKLELCGGFGALANCARATDRLGWTPRYRCGR